MRVLLVEDDDTFRMELVDLLHEMPGVDVLDEAASAEAARSAIAAPEAPSLVVLDVMMPENEEAGRRGETAPLGAKLALEVRKAHPRTRIVVLSSVDREGAVALLLEEVADDFLSKDCTAREMRARLGTQIRAARSDAAAGAIFGEEGSRAALVGESKAMVQVRERIRLVAPTPAPVLITGESGTGKEVVARCLHDGSPWARGPFLPFHAAAVGEGLIEAELFGHRRGAFTGADSDRAGVVEAAAGGTLFLDEIGELPPVFQVKLLRFLDTGSYHRIGEDKPRTARVRLVFATNRNLREEVAAGRFREDLLYRLDVLRVPLPPLRERGKDIGLLARHLAHRVARSLSRKPPAMTDEALVVLCKHGWPGNVRELRNAIERAMILWPEEILDGEKMAVVVGGLGGASSAPVSEPGSWEPGATLRDTVAAAERRCLREALAHHDGNVTVTATSLGVSRRTLQLKMEQHGLRDE